MNWTVWKAVLLVDVLLLIIVTVALRCNNFMNNDGSQGNPFYSERLSSPSPPSLHPKQRPQLSHDCAPPTCCADDDKPSAAMSARRPSCDSLISRYLPSLEGSGLDTNFGGAFGTYGYSGVKSGCSSDSRLYLTSLFSSLYGGIIRRTNFTDILVFYALSCTLYVTWTLIQMLWIHLVRSPEQSRPASNLDQTVSAGATAGHELSPTILSSTSQHDYQARTPEDLQAPLLHSPSGSNDLPLFSEPPKNFILVSSDGPGVLQHHLIHLDSRNTPGSTQNGLNTTHLDTANPKESGNETAPQGEPSKHHDIQ